MFAHLLAIYQLIDHFLHPIIQNFTILFSIKDVSKMIYIQENVFCMNLYFCTLADRVKNKSYNHTHGYCSN